MQTERAHEPPTLALSVLGPLHVTLRDHAGETSVTEFRTVKSQALLAYLAVTGQPQSRLAVAGLLWSESSEKKALNSLRNVLNDLRHLFPDHLDIERQTVTFRSDSPHWLDLAHFAQKTDALAETGAPVSADDLAEAVALYRGPFLQDLDVGDAPEFMVWVEEQRTRWQRRAQRAMSVLAKIWMAQRKYTAAVDLLRHVLTLAPDHEETHRQLMAALGHVGRFGEAAAQYHTCHQLLADRLNVEPMPETTALYQRIEAAQRNRINNLPTDVADFVGREVELAQLSNMLANPESRLITLVGLGGIGKTRLAIEAGLQTERSDALLFLNGVVFVSLVGVHSTAALPLILADALGVSLAGQAEPTVELLNYLRNLEMLIIFDNFEHLLDGSDLLERILQTAVHVKLLVTSRVPVQLDAEWRFDVEGLPCTTAAVPAGTHSAAVTLFQQSAQNVDANFAITDDDMPHVHRICQLVSGIPLAIKLAATWTPTLSCAEIVTQLEQTLDLLTDQLGDTPPRQRSMRVIFDYTWTLLSAPERRLVGALSVFRGSFAEEAAAQVVGMTPTLQAGLMDRSLLHMNMTLHGARYEMHELVRQYAAEKLADEPVAALVQQQHSAYYLALLADQEDALYGQAPQDAAAALKLDIDNIHAAWNWAIQHLDQPEALHDLGRSIEALATFYEVEGWFQEGERTLETAAARLETLLDADAMSTLDHAEAHDVLCQLLIKQAYFAELRSRNDAVQRLTSKALHIARQTQNTLREADALRVWGRTLSGISELDQAIDKLNRALTLYRTLDRPREEAITLNAVGGIYLYKDAPDTGLEVTQQALQLHTELGNRRGCAYSISQIGNACYYQEQYEDALTHLCKALALFDALGYMLGVSRTANNIGYILARLERHSEALPYLQRALRIAQQIGARREQANILESLGTSQFAQGDYLAAQQTFMQALERAEGSGWVFTAGIVRSNLGVLHLEIGDYATALDYLQSGRVQLEEIGTVHELARNTGYLGLYYHRTGQPEKALAHYDAALAALRADAQFDAAPVAVHKATLLLEQNQLDAAHCAAQEGIRMARAANRISVLFAARLVAAQIAHARGEQTEAHQALRTLLDSAHSDAARAHVHYVLWQMTNNVDHATRALDLYEPLLPQAPAVLYRERLDTLRAELPQLK